MLPIPSESELAAIRADGARRRQAHKDTVPARRKAVAARLAELGGKLPKAVVVELAAKWECGLSSICEDVRTIRVKGIDAAGRIPDRGRSAGRRRRRPADR
jgi:hypothetical protein